MVKLNNQPTLNISPHHTFQPDCPKIGLNQNGFVQKAAFFQLCEWENTPSYDLHWAFELFRQLGVQFFGPFFGFFGRDHGQIDCLVAEHQIWLAHSELFRIEHLEIVLVVVAEKFLTCQLGFFAKDFFQLFFKLKSDSFLVKSYYRCGDLTVMVTIQPDKKIGLKWLKRYKKKKNPIIVWYPNPQKVISSRISQPSESLKFSLNFSHGTFVKLNRYFFWYVAPQHILTCQLRKRITKHLQPWSEIWLSLSEILHQLSHKNKSLFEELKLKQVPVIWSRAQEVDMSIMSFQVTAFCCQMLEKFSQ